MRIVRSTVDDKTGVNVPSIRQLTDVLREIEAIDRSTINAWEDAEFGKAVRATERKKLIMTPMWTEACVIFPLVVVENSAPLGGVLLAVLLEHP